MQKLLLRTAFALAAAAAFADTAFSAGEWDVAFAAEGQSLRLAHKASGTEIVGELVFMGPDRATDAKAEAGAEWKIVDARDGAASRSSTATTTRRATSRSSPTARASPSSSTTARRSPTRGSSRIRA